MVLHLFMHIAFNILLPLFCFSTYSLVSACSYVTYLSHSFAVIPYTVDSNSDNREFIAIITQWWFYIFFTYTQCWNCQFEIPESTNYCHMQWGFRGYKNLKASRYDKLGARARTHTHTHTHTHIYILHYVVCKEAL